MLRGGRRRTVFPAGVIVQTFVCLLNERSSRKAFICSRKSGLEQSGDIQDVSVLPIKMCKEEAAGI